MAGKQTIEENTNTLYNYRLMENFVDEASCHPRDTQNLKFQNKISEYL